MRLETFFEKFELFADAPNAVGKMRELVLELATQGKLVDQNSAEGGGHFLLNQIHEKIPPLITDAEEESVDSQLANMPSSWAPARLGEVTEIVRGVTFPGSAKSKSRSDADVACLRTASVQAEIDWDDLIFISSTHVSRSDQWIVPSDIMISMANSYALVGKVAIVRQVPQRATFGAFLAAIRPILIEPYFLLYVLRSPRMQAAFRNSSSQTTNIANISLGRMRPLPFPLPPLAEQKRIVAKVDELMALCDRLEAQQQERDTRHASLARASPTRFAEAPTPANLAFLFHRSYPVTPADLRKAILSLAVQGKLVPQDPRDAPAEALIECISDLREKWSAGKRAKTATRVRELDQSKREYDIPDDWVWCRLGDLVLDFRYGTSRKCARDSTGVPVLRIPNIKNGWVDSTDLKFTDMPTAEFQELRLRKGDLLLVRSNGSENLVGRSAVVSANDEQFAYAGYLVRARIPTEAIFSPYLQIALSTSSVRDQIEGPIRTTSGVKNINTTELSNLVLPLPPLPEQRRIVAKVDQLMAMVDQLEAQLVAAKSRSTALLDAVIHELLNPSAEIVDLAAYRAAMACYAIRKMAAKPYFGRTAAAKVLYLAQAHVGLKLDLRPLRDAAGPLDQWIYDFEREGAQQDWFRVAESSIANGKRKITYQPGRMIAEQSALAVRLLSASQRKEYDRLLSLFADKTTDEAEVIATLFAAWNDFLIDGHAPGDEQIVTEVREHWHEKKARFTPAVLRQWLAWLRQNNLVPTGRLPHTVHQAQLVLN